MQNSFSFFSPLPLPLISDLLSGRLADRLPALAAHCERNKSPLNFRRRVWGGWRVTQPGIKVRTGRDSETDGRRGGA